MNIFTYLLEHEKEARVHAGIKNTGDVVVNGCEESRVPVRSFLPAGWDHPVLLFSVQVQVSSCSSQLRLKLHSLI